MHVSIAQGIRSVSLHSAYLGEGSFPDVMALQIQLALVSTTSDEHGGCLPANNIWKGRGPTPLANMRQETEGKILERVAYDGDHHVSYAFATFPQNLETWIAGRKQLDSPVN